MFKIFMYVFYIFYLFYIFNLWKYLTNLSVLTKVLFFQIKMSKIFNRFRALKNNRLCYKILGNMDIKYYNGI